MSERQWEQWRDASCTPSKPSRYWFALIMRQRGEERYIHLPRHLRSMIAQVRHTQSAVDSIKPITCRLCGSSAIESIQHVLCECSRSLAVRVSRWQREPTPLGNLEQNWISMHRFHVHTQVDYYISVSLLFALRTGQSLFFDSVSSITDDPFTKQLCKASASAALKVLRAWGGESV